MNRKQLLESIKLKIQEFDPVTPSYQSEEKRIKKLLKKEYKNSQLNYQTYLNDWLAKEQEVEKYLADLRTKIWHEFITLINVESGLNIKCTVETHPDDHIKQFLIKTINHELLCLKEKSWTRYITFDRIVLLLSTIGSIVVNIIQACN